ncbi:MAG: GNAT family N-acetyltransferase [Thiotrichales bacterium]
MSDASPTVVIHRGPAGLAQLREGWSTLGRRNPDADFFTQWDWFAAYLAHLEANPDQVRFVELRRAGECRGVLPLRWPTPADVAFNLPLLELPRATGMDLAGLVLDPRERLVQWWPAIRAALAGQGLRGFAIRAAGCLLDSRAALLDGSQSWSVARAQGHSCHFDCRLGHVALQERYSTRLSKILRKADKGLARFGALQLETVTDAATLRPAFDAFLGLEASGWKGASGAATALAFDPARRGFLEALMLGAGAGFMPEINLLRADARPLAAQLCLRRGARLSVLKIAYDAAFSRYSPGSALLDRVLARECATATTRSVSLVTGQPWMALWAPESTPVGDIWWFSHAPIAALVRTWLRIRAFRFDRERSAPAA